MPSAAKLTTSAAEGLPRRRFTVAEVEAMVAAGVMEEDERVELIGGGIGSHVAEGKPARSGEGRASPTMVPAPRRKDLAWSPRPLFA